MTKTKTPAGPGLIVAAIVGVALLAAFAWSPLDLHGVPPSKDNSRRAVTFKADWPSGQKIEIDIMRAGEIWSAYHRTGDFARRESVPAGTHVWIKSRYVDAKNALSPAPLTVKIFLTTGGNTLLCQDTLPPGSAGHARCDAVVP